MNFFAGGACLRKVAGAENRVFLTFDDGPFPSSTPLLLDFFARTRVQATFFLVAERARAEPLLTRSLVEAGHSVGNHSLDHRYGHFFRGSRHLARWIASAQAELAEITGQEPVAFRSPAGVRTPELSRALRETGLPLVHWNHRFFDTTFPFSEYKALRAGRRAKAGDIFLLHDIPRRDPASFLRALGCLGSTLRQQGLEPAALRKDHLAH
jgi:peptidoglycan-N-acetylglucosamine deacetylase